MATLRRVDYDEDDYAPVGTPFDLLETEDDVAKAKARKDKEHYVLDEQGRRRFHGAFTGGYSAGYFNTVGSKEGWTPGTFVSSRQSKTEFSGQRPEDFMDAEDLGVHGIAPREVSTRDNFQQRGAVGGVKRPSESRPSVIPGEAPLQNLIIPARLSVGARLLRSMGWREGQGVGPRTQRPQTSEGKKMYGCSLPATTPNTEPSNSGYIPEELQGFSFAPQDVSLRQFEGKDDMHGIGYRGMEESGVLTARKTKKAVHGMSGEAFGLGALEEEDADDNVYGEESMTSYDVALAGEGDVGTERKFGWTGGVEDSWGLKSFVKASKSPSRSKVYHAPEVPRDFVPIHRFSILNIKSAGGPDQTGPKQPVTVTERNQLLADTPGSVFSLMSAVDRERIRRLASSGGADTPTQTPPQAPPTVGHAPQLRPPAPPIPGHAPQLRPPAPPIPGHAHWPRPPAPPTINWQQTVAQAGLHTRQLPTQQKSSSLGDTAIDNIKPFPNNPLKQARYEAFLNGHRVHSDSESVAMTEWERQRERDEFSRMRRVYQPLSVSLSRRFTKETDGETKIEKSPEPDSVQAARADMFGVLTREVLEWHPHPVLCKRFDVPDPHPKDGLVGTVTEKQKQASATRQIKFLPVQKSGEETPVNKPLAAVTESTSHVVEGFRGPAPAGRATGTERQTPTAPKEKMAAENGPETSPEETKEEARPPMDLFKAIFAESSSSESEAEEEAERGTSPAPPPPQEAAAASSQVGDVADQKSRKTRWQDLSVVASRPLTTAADHHESNTTSDTAEKTAGKEGGDAAANRDTVANDNRAVAVFGPALPPGFGETGAEKEEEEGERKRNEKHKHRHHRSSSRKGKRRKHEVSSDEKGHKHRKRGDKKESKHKH